MTNNHFEKRIKEKLNQFEIEPSENLFENILEKRATRSKGVLRFSYFKLGVAMLSLVLVTTVVAIYWFSPGNSDGLSGNAKNIAVSGNGASAELKEGQMKEQNPASGQAIVGDNSTSYKKDVENSSAAQNENIKITHNSGDKAGIRKNGKTRNPEKGKVASKNAVAKNNKNNIDAKGRSGKTSLDDYYDNGYNIEERYFNMDASNRPLMASVSHKGHSHLMVYHSVSKEKLDNLNLSYLFLEPIKTLPANKNESEKIALIDHKSTEHPVKLRKPVFVDMLFTPMMSFHSVNGYDNANSGYKSLPVSCYNEQYSARVTYLITKNIGLFAGVGYMKLNTAFSGETSKSETAERYETVINYINDPIKGPIAFTAIDTVSYTKTDQVSYDFKNTYDILSIPLGLNYNFGYRSFDFAVNGSALMNIYTHVKGSNADFVRYQTTTFNSDKKQFGIGGAISFMAAYKLTNRFKLIVEPNLQYFKINSQLNGSVVNEKVLNSGLSIGLRYTVF